MLELSVRVCAQACARALAQASMTFPALKLKPRLMVGHAACVVPVCGYLRRLLSYLRGARVLCLWGAPSLFTSMRRAMCLGLWKPLSHMLAMMQASRLPGLFRQAMCSNVPIK